jgi:hypothetical protein
LTLASATPKATLWPSPVKIGCARTAGHAQVLSEKRFDQGCHMQHVDGWMEESTLEFQPAVGITSITCANDKCRKLSLSVNPGRTVKGDRDIFLKQKWVLPSTIVSEAAT